MVTNNTATFKFVVVFLLLAASCNRTPQTAEQFPAFNSQLSTDFEPTGNAKLDSLLLVAATAPRDTNLVWLYNSIGYMYQDNDSEKSKEYFLKVRALSEQLDCIEGRYLYARGFATLLTRQG
jgi:hypothetical protein